MTETHKLKCWPVFYRELVAGTVTHQLRWHWIEPNTAKVLAPPF